MTRRSPRSAWSHARRNGALVAALAAVALTACGSDAGDNTGTPASESAATPRGTVTVFAAASLTAAFTEIGEAFEAAHAGADVELVVASSSDLARQIVEGAPADVYASADDANMTSLTDAGRAGGDPATFATNSLQIAVEPGNPLGIAGLADLADPDVLYVTCAPEVPIGAYAAQALEAAGVVATPASFEENVKGIVAKVALGEADAGIVYRTDVAAADDDVDGVDLPPDVNVVASYPIVAVRDAPNMPAAEAFVDFVLGEEAQAILREHGFGAP